tara:strand:- start:49 stop:390 length:342 start_codon:yes stop_codon:yes gene_type:complete
MQNYYLIINCYKKTPKFTIYIKQKKMDGVPLLLLFVTFIIFGILSMLLYVYCKDKTKTQIENYNKEQVRKKREEIIKRMELNKIKNQKKLGKYLVDSKKDNIHITIYIKQDKS